MKLDLSKQSELTKAMDRFSNLAEKGAKIEREEDWGGRREESVSQGAEDQQSYKQSNKEEANDQEN